MCAMPLLRLWGDPVGCAIQGAAADAAARHRHALKLRSTPL